MPLGLTRRHFLRLAQWATTFALLASPGIAWAREQVQSWAIAIHQGTRNTLTGAIGVVLRRMLGRPAVFKPYSGAARTDLPAAATDPALSLDAVLRSFSTPAGFDGEQFVSLAALTRLLESANGVTGGSPGGRRLRAAPSAGALYAGEVYVVAERVEGLPAGLYYYSPLSQELALLKAGSQLARVTAALETPTRGQSACAAVLLTNVFSRYRWRYANRGYRYALIDSGHIGENLRLATRSAGLSEWGPLRFEDDRLNDLLGIDGLDEAVCAVHAVGAPGSETTAAQTSRRLVEAHTTDAELPEDADDAPDRYHAWTKLVPAKEGSAPPLSTPKPEAPASATANRPKPQRVVRLPARGSPDTTVEAAIQERRSARAFTDAPMSEADLGFVLAAADGHPAARRSDGIELMIVVNRTLEGVQGVAPGLYRVRAESRELDQIRGGDLTGDLVSACLGQEKAGQGAVAILMVGDIQAAAALGGDRSYRDLCLESGSVAQRVYLAAESTGLAARNLAAYVDDSLNELVGLDGRSRAVLHLTMLGLGD